MELYGAGGKPINAFSVSYTKPHSNDLVFELGRVARCLSMVRSLDIRAGNCLPPAAAQALFKPMTRIEYVDIGSGAFVVSVCCS